MASPTNETNESGFATPAATAISLAIAVMASAVMAASVATLRHEHAEFARTHAEYALAGAEAEAALSLLGSQNQGSVRWTMTLGGSSVEATAEPEALKLGLLQTAALASDQLGRLQVSDADALRARITALATDKTQVANELADADAAPLWRLCGRSLVSPYGRALSSPAMAWGALQPNVIGSHVGEVWRIRLASADGWVEDQTVRFTGAMEHPIDVIASSFGRGSQMGTSCG